MKQKGLFLKRSIDDMDKFKEIEMTKKRAFSKKHMA